MKTGGGSGDEADEKLSDMEPQFGSLMDWQKRLAKLMQPEAFIGIEGGVDTSGIDHVGDANAIPQVPDVPAYLPIEERDDNSIDVRAGTPSISDSDNEVDDSTRGTLNRLLGKGNQQKPTIGTKGKDKTVKDQRKVIMDVQSEIEVQVTRIADAMERMVGFPAAGAPNGIVVVYENEQREQNNAMDADVGDDVEHAVDDEEVN